MTMISVDRTFLMDLLDSILKILQDEINKILKKWNYSSIELFLADSKAGIVEETEDDAVCLKNLLDKREELLQYKWQWSKE